MNFCLSDLVPPLRWSDASAITLLRGQPELPEAWWRSLPMPRVLAALGPESLGELLTEIAIEQWPAAAIGDVLPALHVLDPDDADEPQVAIALDRVGSWPGLLSLTGRELLDQPFIQARPVLNVLFTAVLVRLAPGGAGAVERGGTARVPAATAPAPAEAVQAPAANVSAAVLVTAAQGSGVEESDALDVEALNAPEGRRPAALASVGSAKAGVAEVSMAGAGARRTAVAGIGLAEADAARTDVADAGIPEADGLEADGLEAAVAEVGVGRINGTASPAGLVVEAEAAEEAVAEPAPGPDLEAASEPEPDAVSTPWPDAVSELKSEAVPTPRADAVAEAEAAPGPEPEAAAGSEREAVAGLEPEDIAGPEPGDVAGPEPGDVAGSASEAVAGSASEAVAGSEPEGAAEPEPEEVDRSPVEVAPEPEPEEATWPEPESDAVPEPVAAEHALLALVEAAFADLDDRSWAVAQNRVFTAEPSAAEQLAKLFAVTATDIVATEARLRARVRGWLADEEAAPYREHLDELRATIGTDATQEKLLAASDWHGKVIRALDVPAWQFVQTTLNLAAAPAPSAEPEPEQAAEPPPPPPEPERVPEPIHVPDPVGAAGPPQFSAFTPQPLPVEQPEKNEQNGDASGKPYQPLKDVSQTRRCFRQPDGRWYLRVDVAPEHLEGGECALPTGFASYLGLSPGEARTVRSAAGELTMSWHGRPVLESVSRLLSDVGAKAGGHVFLTLSDEGVLRARHLPMAAPSADPVTKALRLVCYTAPDAGLDVAARVIATRIGMTGPVGLSEVLARLRERGDRDLLSLLD
jgi:hypothetical protein